MIHVSIDCGTAEEALKEMARLALGIPVRDGTKGAFGESARKPVEPAAGTATATDSSPVVEQPAAVSLDAPAPAKNKGGRPRKNRDTAPVSEAPAEAAEVSASQPAVENTGSEQGGLEPSPPVPALTQTTVAEAAVVAPISDAEINSLGKAVYDLIGMPAFIELRKEFGVADKKMKEIPQEVRPALMAKMRAVQKAELAKQAVG